MEKIFKTLDTLKLSSLTNSESNIPGSITSSVIAACDTVKTKKKERIVHCLAVTDAVNNVQNMQEFPKILESVSEVLFQLCNDQDSDIRLVAVDCLNRIFRTLKDKNQHRFQMEVFREIKKNQNARSLKQALTLFSHMSSLIRKQKCRAFMVSLFPCFIQISKRTEEFLYDNLALYLSEIFKHLGPFLNDNELKILCKEFLSNLESNSTIIRRASAEILVAICLYSRKPNVFVPKLLAQVIELLLPNLMEKSVQLLLGSLLCIRQCIQPIYELLRESTEESIVEDITLNNLIQVYEICLILCNHDDHNIITTSLEALQQLLSSPYEKVGQKLTSPNGIENSIDAERWTTRASEKQILSSFGSISFSDETQNLEGDSDLPKFRSLISSQTNSKEEFEIEESLSSNRRYSDVFISEELNADLNFNSEDSHHSDEDNKAVDPPSSYILHNFPDLQIGSLYDEKKPIYYCARFLTYNFLLAGQKGHQRTDEEVRVSVKSLALNCLINLINLSPEIFFLSLSSLESQANEREAEIQTIEDVLLLSNHCDPLIRGSVYLIVGNLINSILTRKLQLQTFPSGSTKFDSILPILCKGLKDNSSLGVKYAISGISKCLSALFNISHGGSNETADEIFNLLLEIPLQNQYWLIKVDIVELLSSIEKNPNPNYKEMQEQIYALLLEFLFDEDARVRMATTLALVRIIASSSKRNQRMKILCDKCLISEVDVDSEVEKINKNYCECTYSYQNINSNLEYVLSKMIPNCFQLFSKNSFAGYYGALSALSDEFSPKNFKSAWNCSNNNNSESNSLLNLSIDLLQTSAFVYELNIHQNLLNLACNLFVGVVSGINEENQKERIDSQNQNILGLTIQLFHHCLAILKIYQIVIENSILTSGPKKSSSPVLSPVKKFTTKSSEPEKKSSGKSFDSDQEKKPFLAKSQSLPNANNLFKTLVASSHFKKIEDNLYQSCRVYKSNLDNLTTQKFTGLLSSALNTIGIICTYSQADNLGLSNFIEEILTLTTSVFYLNPVSTIKCVKRIIKCLFSFDNSISSVKCTTLDNLRLIHDPIKRFEEFSKIYFDAIFQKRKKNNLSRPSSELSSLGNYIRQFEPIVIIALMIYTTTSKTEIQTEVLSLLSQLIRVHVNYGLIDSNQVFLGFVIKQIGFLEEGHIKNAQKLVQEMFQFFALLSNEHNQTKRFIDIPKLLRLCDGLVASVQNPVSHSIPALRQIVYALFLTKFSSNLTDLERKEVETQREVLFQMLMKLRNTSQTFSVLWILIEGRRATNREKWIEESAYIASYFLPAIARKEIVIKKKVDFFSMMALFYSLNPASLEPKENLVEIMINVSNIQVEDVDRFQHWTLLINSHFLIVIKLLPLNYDDECLKSIGISAKLIINLLLNFTQNFEKLLHAFENRKDYFNEQLSVFLEAIVSFIRKGKNIEDFKSDLFLEENVANWMKITENIFNLYLPIFRQSLVQLFSCLLYPHEILWNQIFKNFKDDKETQIAILNLVEELNKSESFMLEEWIIKNHLELIINQIDHPSIASFFSRLSNFRLNQVTEQMKMIFQVEVNLEKIKNLKNFLKLMEKLFEDFPQEMLILSLKSLQASKNSFLSLEISQFSSFVVSHLKGKNITLIEDNLKFVVDFSNQPWLKFRYPRLCILLKSTFESEFNPFVNKFQGESPISVWSSEEINEAEGNALAKMMNSLNYSQIMKIMNQSDFNLSILQYTFRFLHNSFLNGEIMNKIVMDLLSSERHSLMEKHPLGVSTLDFIVETLDNWENCLPFEDIAVEKIEDFIKKENLVKSVNFKPKLRHMWTALTEMYNFKKSVLCSEEISEEQNFNNNFIPTKIFTFSFLYVKNQLKNIDSLPIDLIQDFLNFTSVAISDAGFLTFFDVRDNPTYLSMCIFTLSYILKKLVSFFKINYKFSPVNNVSHSYDEMNETFKKILTEFDYMTDFIYQVKTGKLSFNPDLFIPLKRLIGGLGRCELVNAWVLISQLGWKPQSITSLQFFPPVQQIPLYILQNEKELLYTYVFKLNIIGIASKIQFEENWMTFLSVINSYGEENAQLQIVVTGLKALSMMLKQTVKVSYIPENDLQKLNKFKKVELVLKNIQPKICEKYDLPILLSNSCKKITNEYKVDINSCIRFLIDLFSQWTQNIQGKMPLLLLSEVIHSIICISQYFEESFHYTWMFETLFEIYKTFEKEDETLLTHLIYGIFYSATKVTLTPDTTTSLIQILENSLNSPLENIRIAGVKSSLIFLQQQPDNVQILNTSIPYVMKNIQLNEILNDSEENSYGLWELLLFTLNYCPLDSLGGINFENEVFGYIQTILSPLNKVYVSIRILVLKALRIRYLLLDSKHEIKSKIYKLAAETIKTPNINAIFFESVKFYVSNFYEDFKDFYQESEQDPEALMQMAEKSEVFFKILKSGSKFSCQIASKILPVLIMDFFPPSEILNRTIAEFLSPLQSSPEYLAPSLAQIFEKARKVSKDRALVHEWILAGLPSFLSNSDVSRTIWSLTLFFVGVSKANDIAYLLPFAELRRRYSQINELFNYSAIDFYNNLEEKAEFKNFLQNFSLHPNERNPYQSLLNLIDNLDSLK